MSVGALHLPRAHNVPTGAQSEVSGSFSFPLYLEGEIEL